MEDVREAVERYDRYKDVALICDNCLLPIGEWKKHTARGLLLCGDCFKELKTFFRSANV